MSMNSGQSAPFATRPSILLLHQPLSHLPVLLRPLAELVAVQSVRELRHWSRRQHFQLTVCEVYSAIEGFELQQVLCLDNDQANQVFVCLDPNESEPPPLSHGARWICGPGLTLRLVREALEAAAVFQDGTFTSGGSVERA
jgi:hypothetical protein